MGMGYGSGGRRASLSEETPLPFFLLSTLLLRKAQDAVQDSQIGPALSAEVVETSTLDQTLKRLVIE